MTEKMKRKSAAHAAKGASASGKPAVKAGEARAKTGKTAVKTKGAAKTTKKTPPAKVKPAAVRGTKRVSTVDEAKLKAKAPATKARRTKSKAVSSAGYSIGDPVLDPVGDTTDGEARAYTGEAETQAQAEMDAFRADTNVAAMDSDLEAGRGLEATQAAMEAGARAAAEDAAVRGRVAKAESKLESEPREPGRLERLQKILSQAGIASRRHAEEMIVAGRVMVNGQVVTQLGSKADPARDHIRVDGKLLHGAERHRYFVLNKPKEYVTTVSDPEGRPTVMKFFSKMQERLYPVGRLDYQSEGLLLMTNDGELANLLTKAESGVEKTYLVKVAGQPSEEQLERLSAGVAIEKGETGSERARSAPARIRQVRHGDNPWYEVVLTEGRNRELRKMFAAIGHFAEKIRRVGYGPLELDVEPGKMRELTADEVDALRRTAEGRMKPRQVRVDRVLPKEAGIPAEKRARFAGSRSAPSSRFARPAGRFGEKEQREKKPWGRADQPRGPREDLAQKKEWQPRDREFRERGTGRPASGERKPFSGGERRERPGARFQEGNKPFDRGDRVNPGIKSGTGGTRGGGQSSRFGGRREGQQPFGGRPRTGTPPFQRPKFDRPRFGGLERPEREKGHFEGGQRKPFQPRGARPQFDRGARPAFKPGGERPRFDRGARPAFKPGGERPQFDRGARPAFKPGGARPQFDRGARPAFKPGGERPQFDRGARPAFKPGGERLKIERSERPAFKPGGERSKGFGQGARFGAKPGGFAKSRSDDKRGRNPGFGRPGAGRGGWKRG
jgi:23S rRNA pseudouridine2605 synthase